MMRLSSLLIGINFNYFSSLILVLNERTDIALCANFFNHIFYKVRGCLQKRICENRICLQNKFNMAVNNQEMLV